MADQSFPLFHFILRVSKEDSAFVYFQLEARDGLCFYSTLDAENGQIYRDIEIMGDQRLEEEMHQTIASLRKEFPVEVLKQGLV